MIAPVAFGRKPLVKARYGAQMGEKRDPRSRSR
jgi:hypothetical protein